MTDFKKDSLKQKLRSGKNVYGTCITSPAPMWPKVVGNLNLDFVFLDTEHIALDRSELSKMCRMYQSMGLTPIVRIPKPDRYRASQVIDDGALGVIAPYLETSQQIKDLVGATKYRPLKGKVLESYLNDEKEIATDLQNYLNDYNLGNLCIANIESMPAVENLDELLSIKGLDAVFIGPHDLSISMGIPEQYDHPDFIKMAKKIIQKAREHTLGVGIHFSLEPQRQIDWMKEGVNIIVHSSDIALFSQKLKADLNIIKSASNDQNHIADSDGSVTI